MPRAGGHAIERRAVAAQARRGEVRIVARRAQQLAAALLKAGGLAQAVRGAHDFEFPVPAGSRRMVEVQLVIA
jgi:hypothetical protein